jgi:hypothetical protein
VIQVYAEPEPPAPPWPPRFLVVPRDRVEGLRFAADEREDAVLRAEPLRVEREPPDSWSTRRSSASTRRVSSSRPRIRFWSSSTRSRKVLMPSSRPFGDPAQQLLADPQQSALSS